ncbi:MAG: hypothetical protein SH850_12870 [Planctomycetaceae bacterium]|nr:hypothetical protein [Planctomycetaceae bacterium]
MRPTGPATPSSRVAAQPQSAVRPVNYQISVDIQPPASPRATGVAIEPKPEPESQSPTAATSPERRIELPLQGSAIPGKIQITGKGDRISLTARDAPVDQVVGLIAQQHGLNVVTAATVKGTISVTLSDVGLDAALDAVLKVNGYTWVRDGDIILVTTIAADSTTLPSVQGRQLRVFTLNYLAAADADKIVKGLLSPVGKSVIVESSPTDKRRTRDQLIIEDLPEYIERAADSLAQTDLPPKQVLIEAYILQINLKDDLRHGVDIQAILARIDNTRVSMKTVGFANPNASPAFFFGIDGTDLDVLVEAIKLTTDAKTLASPKVLVVNGQEARIQVGSQLGYFVTTTTQTSTMQQVDFLELGVVLKVTPQITDSGEILMHVKPEISSGQINPATGLPEEDTTQVDTTVILPDGNGMIIGGLIKEGDTESQTKIPLVGDLWVVGRFFQRRTVHRERNEILIALVPRVVTYDSGHPVCPKPDPGDEVEWSRATTPLVGPQLQRVDRRPLEPELPDAIRNPRKLDLSRVPQLWKKPTKAYPPPADFYFPSSDERTQGNTPRPLIYDSQLLSGPELSLQPISEIPPLPPPAAPPPLYEVPALPPPQGIAP